MTWHVWSDGSCLHGRTKQEAANPPRGLRGAGGWAAVWEHAHDGSVVRGRVPETTNVRMELTAAIEGLRVVPSDDQVVLHTDATNIVSIYLRWRDGCLESAGRRPDRDLWRLLGAEFDRVRVIVDLLGRGHRPEQHARADKIAGAEARALIAGIGPSSAIALPMSRRQRRQIRRVRLAELGIGITAKTTQSVIVHSPACDRVRCTTTCRVLLYPR